MVDLRTPVALGLPELLVPDASAWRNWLTDDHASSLRCLAGAHQEGRHWTKPRRCASAGSTTSWAGGTRGVCRSGSPSAGRRAPGPAAVWRTLPGMSAEGLLMATGQAAVDAASRRTAAGRRPMPARPRRGTARPCCGAGGESAGADDVEGADFRRADVNKHLPGRPCRVPVQLSHRKQDASRRACRQRQFSEVKVDLPVNANLPQDYLPGERLRLEAYRALANATTNEAVDAVRLELLDRFGPMPLEVDNLLAVARFKVVCRKFGITEVSLQGSRCGSPRCCCRSRPRSGCSGRMRRPFTSRRWRRLVRRRFSGRCFGPCCPTELILRCRRLNAAQSEPACHKVRNQVPL
jgi:TRCF domain